MLQISVNGINMLDTETIIIPFAIANGVIYYPPAYQEIRETYGDGFRLIVDAFFRNKGRELHNGTCIPIKTNEVPVIRKPFGKIPNYKAVLFYYDSGEGLTQTLLTNILETARKADIIDFALPIPRNYYPYELNERATALIMMESLAPFKVIYNIHIVLTLSESDAYEVFKEAKLPIEYPR